MEHYKYEKWYTNQRHQYNREYPMFMDEAKRGEKILFHGAKKEIVKKVYLA